MSYLKIWVRKHERYHSISIYHNVSDCTGHADYLFLVSCTEIVPQTVIDRHSYAMVLHASDLPKGRGWSPYIWDVINGKDTLTVCLLEVSERVDRGRVWRRERIELDGTELFQELFCKVCEAELSLMSWALKNVATTEPKEQIGEPSYYEKRTPEDSRIDPYDSIANQFDLLRVCDQDRFPPYFDFRGTTYKIVLQKVTWSNVK